MKNAIALTESLTREQKLTMLADSMMENAARLHESAMALKSELKKNGGLMGMPDSVARRNSKIKLVPQGR